jgi:hypothetical protein
MRQQAKSECIVWHLQMIAAEHITVPLRRRNAGRSLF